MGQGEFRTRAVLAPSMLLLIAAIYWLDISGVLGTKQGVLSACVLALLGFGGVVEYVHLLRGGGFAVANAPLLVVSIALFVSALPFGWGQLDKELYPLVLGTLLLLFPLAVRSLGREDMRVGLETQGSTLLGFIFISWPIYL